MEVIENINSLLAIIKDSKKVPFTDNIVINKYAITDLALRIKKCIPEELFEAQKIINEKYELLIDARKEAEVIVKDAESYARDQVMSHEVTKQAEKLSEDMIYKARINAREVRLGAKEYSKELLYDVENSLKEYGDDFLNSIEKDFEAFINKFELELKGKIESIQNNVKQLENYK